MYEHEAIKARIIHLRAQQVSKAKGQIPQREQASSTSKDTMIAALQKRVRERAAEIEQLKRQVEVAYGLLATRVKQKTKGYGKLSFSFFALIPLDSRRINPWLQADLHDQPPGYLAEIGI